MKIGYIRVSTTEQNTARQEAYMREIGAEKVFIDMVSGKTAKRDQLQAMLSFVREGDTVYIDSYSRLARSTRDLLEIVDRLKSKGVEFVSRKENIDTTTPAGRLMITLFAGFYQFERECALEAQAEGIAEAKKAGKYAGRKPIKVDQKKFNQVYVDWKANRITAVRAQDLLGLKSSTFYRLVKEYEAEQQRKDLKSGSSGEV